MKSFFNCFIDNIFFIGIISSILAVMLITLYRKITLFIIFCSFYGTYYEIEDSQKKIKYSLKFRYKNFCRMDDKLIIKNESDNPWEGEITISYSNPYEAYGIYNYPDERWGNQKFYFNKRDTKIFVISDFSPSGSEKISKYSLVKQQLTRVKSH